MSETKNEAKTVRDDHVRAGEVSVEEARVHLSRFNSRLGEFITRASLAFDALDRICEVISCEGCSCECGHDSESHDEGCDRCLACRIEAAIGGAS